MSRCYFFLPFVFPFIFSYISLSVRLSSSFSILVQILSYDLLYFAFHVSAPSATARSAFLVVPCTRCIKASRSTCNSSVSYQLQISFYSTPLLLSEPHLLIVLEFAASPRPVDSTIVGMHFTFVPQSFQPRTSRLCPRVRNSPQVVTCFQ